MKISKKDKSFILLIVTLMVIFYSIYSVLSHVFFAATFSSSDVGRVTVNQEVSKDERYWFNTSRSLQASDLRNRVVLLHFWSEDCVTCDYVLSEVERLEHKFGSKLTVIGVHAKKGDETKNAEKIVRSILKNHITYPVVNDPNLEIMKSFSIKENPSLVLINLRGEVIKTYDAKQDFSSIDKDIHKLISRNKYKINSESLPLFFEKNNAASNVLSFPSKIKYTKSFEYKSRKIPAIFISNNGDNNIVVTNLLGEIIVKIGDKMGGFEDGSFSEAAFNSPGGVVYDAEKQKLYVSDTGNNALREINFKTNKVTTLIGSGERGTLVTKDGIGSREFALNAPQDIEFFPDKQHIVITNAGTHQLLKFNVKNRVISVLAGNASDGSVDGKYPDNSISKVSDLAMYDGKLYFTDLNYSSLRVLDEDGEVETLINGKKSGSLKKPLGLTVDDTGVYIADSGSNQIKKYNFESQIVSRFIGGETKGKDGKPTITSELNEPNGIVPVLNHFYISDSGNNRILSVNRGNLQANLLDVMPALKLSKEGFLQYLPNMQKFDKATVASDKEILVKIDVKKGWKINENGPSFINLLELKNNNKADLLASFDWNAILDENIRLSKLTSGKKYTLQGVIYYCEDKKNALCYVKSYEQKIKGEKGDETSEIIVELDY